MDFMRILTGKEKPLPIYAGVVVCLEKPLAFPDMIEPIYREAMNLDDETLAALWILKGACANGVGKSCVQ